MDNQILLFFLALVPIVWLIVSLGVLKMPGHIACSIALVITLLLSILVWKFSFVNALTGALEGIVMGLWPIVYIIIAAVFTYNLTTASGSMDTIKKMMTGVSSDKRILVLILAWGFGGFLEAIAGFGTAVAIPAGIMAALGFGPVVAAVMCLIANTTPTAFGAIGLPVTTLAQVAGLDVMHLSYVVTIQLFVLILIIPFVLVAIAGGGVKAIKGVFGITLASGLAFALPQIVVAKFIGAELPAIVGSICCLGVTIFIAKKFYHRDTESADENKVSAKEGFIAWLPFIFVFLLIILCSSLVPPINHALNMVKTSIPIYTGEGAKPYTFAWLACPGTLIIIATFLGGLCQGMSFKEIAVVLGKTVKQMAKTAITVCSIVGLAKVMGYSGMISVIAAVLVALTGNVYPLIAPIIGALGTFVTGSDTSANVLFGQLQVEAAQAIGADPYWIAAANMAGATAGKMISPQSIAVATAATGLIGQEGRILGSTIKYCAVYVILIGLVVFFGGPLLGF
ncbi:L-lactate permease [Eubacterium sp.]|uniref:L-lactate permease n=1 Tax=Eubacterium sp. TaxID=142586 RepID=UPI002FC77E07